VRRKRLKHDAFILCHMFCGWRLVNCYGRLVALGSGVLDIDVLTAQCRLNGQPVEPLPIAWELHHWLREDLAAQGVPIEAVRSARLEVRLEFSEVAPRARVSRTAPFGADGEHFSGPAFHRCAIACRSELTTDEVVYSAGYEDVEEWPLGWPNAEPHSRRRDLRQGIRFKAGRVGRGTVTSNTRSRSRMS
jgi:hypothetical protein